MSNIGESCEGLPPGADVIAGPRVQRQVLLKAGQDRAPLVYASSWWSAGQVLRFASRRFGMYPRLFSATAFLIGRISCLSHYSTLARAGGQIPSGQVETDLGQPGSRTHRALQVRREQGILNDLSLSPPIIQGGAAGVPRPQCRARGAPRLQGPVLGAAIHLLARQPAAHAHIRSLLAEAQGVPWTDEPDMMRLRPFSREQTMMIKREQRWTSLFSYS